jgi:hypothetical protein
VLEERKRIMRGRPLPGSLKPTDAKHKRTRDAAPTPVNVNGAVDK